MGGEGGRGNEYRKGCQTIYIYAATVQPGQRVGLCARTFVDIVNTAFVSSSGRVAGAQLDAIRVQQVHNIATIGQHQLAQQANVLLLDGNVVVE